MSSKITENLSFVRLPGATWSVRWEEGLDGPRCLLDTRPLPTWVKSQSPHRCISPGAFPPLLFSLFHLHLSRSGNGSFDKMIHLVIVGGKVLLYSPKKGTGIRNILIRLPHPGFTIHHSPAQLLFTEDPLAWKNEMKTMSVFEDAFWIYILIQNVKPQLARILSSHLCLRFALLVTKSSTFFPLNNPLGPYIRNHKNTLS